VPSDNVTPKEVEKIKIYKCMHRNPVNVKHEIFCDTRSHRSHRNSNQRTEKIPGRSTRQAFHRFIAKKKTAILGTSHTLKKVLHSEA
jgi:hypothetical protein